MTVAGGITYSYDANGNLTGNSAGMSLSYNAKDQTTSITPAGGSATAMTYAGEGQSDRTQAGSTTFTSNALGLGYETTAGASIYYTRSPTGELIGQRHPSGGHYLLTDGLGSVAKVIDASGSVVTTERYDPFGKTAASTGTLANALKFAGEYKDPSGLYKIGERYFDPDRGAWTQEDPIVQHNAFGTYSYANADPVNNVDPSGAISVTGVAKAIGRSAAKVYQRVAFPVCVCAADRHSALAMPGRRLSAQPEPPHHDLDVLGLHVDLRIAVSEHVRGLHPRLHRLGAS